ncbi:uncharacterized protein LOC123307946 isoform X2 [Coccinella septempunctata]|uniref:uncharacterized protein LOC123307946 isoform X2 n=1 Tax=Coccinella septempunctata TaxID=41139 RepID=UPI001D092832|nr:uncharacterized protein LOC123307946 isoform X2 [Coccinella septempunctata]
MDLLEDGYREGIEEGRNKVFQQYFDGGYKEGFKNGFELGQRKGEKCAESTLNQIELCQAKELEKSSTGACILCQDEKNMSLPISIIKLKQIEILQNSNVNIANKE